MRSQLERKEIDRLVAEGLNDCQISRQLRIPRTTVRDWRRRLHVKGHHHALCPRCWLGAAKPARFVPGDYSELLGLYLGDGCISKAERIMRLRICLDAKYPVIVRDSRELLQRCFPWSSVGLVHADQGHTAILNVYSAHMACLFPQHGPGKKHQRRIVLESWQDDIVRQEPWRLIKGLIRSDGCCFVNRTGPYSYVSFQFSNKSADIRALFMAACDRLELQYRPAQDYVRINRRESVERMLLHVGVKQ